MPMRWIATIVGRSVSPVSRLLARLWLNSHEREALGSLVRQVSGELAQQVPQVKAAVLLRVRAFRPAPGQSRRCEPLQDRH